MVVKNHFSRQFFVKIAYICILIRNNIFFAVIYRLRIFLRFTVFALVLLAAQVSVAQTDNDSLSVILPEEQLLPIIDSIPTDTLLSSDTVSAVRDTIPEKKKKKETIEAPVVYQSTDSMVWIRGGNASLYGKSSVDYQNINLKSAIIRMAVDSSLVYADGVRDSLGNWTDTPVFKDGSTPYESIRMSYNFKTKKGYINEIVTQQGEGYMSSAEAKKGPEGEYYIEDGIYTTCDEHEDPHFGVRITRAKVRPGKDVVFGPAYLEVLGVPLPLFLPFGFFPFTESDYASGIIVPAYGDEMSRGFYLKDGGYYFALSDKFDLKVLGEIFTKGSWGLSAESKYKKRYKYSGNLYMSTLTTKLGDKGMPDYSVSKDFKVRWTQEIGRASCRERV